MISQRTLRRSLVISIALASWLATPAMAHPLGNFTINHLTELKFSHGRADVRYVLDMAEIPTFQAMRAVTPDGKMTTAQLATWAASEAQTLLPQIDLRTGDTPVALTIDRSAARTRPGAGGLPLIYFTLDAHGAVANATKTLTYNDETFAGRLGWRDVIVAPQTEPTHELQAYPNALLGSPRDLTGVNVALAGDGTSAAVTANVSPDAAPVSSAGASVVRSNQLSDMLAKGTSDWSFVFLTLLVAVALGALHALEPGHGKTLLAISLVGARATVKQATILASSLTVAHTIGVLALGLAISLLKGYFVPEAIYPWITLVSGIVIAVIGARAVQRQIQQRQPLAHAHGHAHAATHPHEHPHVHHPHAHDHGQAHTHDHGHGHSHDHGNGHSHDHDDVEHARLHLIPGSAPLTFGGTVWAAMSGGIAPCPAALVVLLAAIALNQVTYGLFVIVAFSFGLAATLTGLGIAVVRGASWLQGRPQFERFVHLGPLVSAVVIATIGAIMVGQGFAQQGVSISPLIVTAVTALAIAGYAFSHPFAHGTGTNAAAEAA
jgi:ABC-type nickel/cobalt efflux system permease component RcnA